jgi:hypothetical protein
MPVPLEGASQVLRPWASLHAEKTRWQIGDEPHQLTAVEPVVRDGLSCLIAADKVEPALADVETNRFDVHGNVLLMG